jgi:hypothetical protein
MLNELAKEVHEIAVEHGWWETDRNFGESLALIHSEVSEVLEDWRKGRELNVIHWKENWDGDKVIRNKPDGIPIEFADIIIRILDLCAYYNIDIETAIKEKIAYNRERPYRHGNLKA